LFQLNTVYFNQFDFYLGRILFINPASIIHYSFHHFSFSLYIIIFITPACIYTLLFSSLQLLFTLFSFNHSSFYLYIICFVTPASTYTVFYSLIQLLLDRDFFITPACIYKPTVFFH